MKKLLSFLLSIMLILSVVPMGLFSITASAATATSGTTGDCTWKLDGTVLTISGNGAMGNYYGYGYTGFSLPWGQSVTEVIIKTGVTSIGEHAFAGCSELRSITIPDSATSIGNAAFIECISLTSVMIPGSITSIGDEAFNGCRGLRSITIPGSVTSIGRGAFVNCRRLTSVTIPESITSIGNSTFSSCTGLTSVTIPNGVTNIENFAFLDCAGLTSVIIPGSVTSIGESAFERCTGLTSITIPNSVTSIGYFAFRDCTGLTSITIPDSVTSIGNFIFKGCRSLTSVTIPDSIKSIGTAFSGCTGLTSITIPNSVTSIGDYAFSDCTGLTNITIPSSVTSIGNYVFKGCAGLTSITIPNSITSIGDCAFYDCKGLTSITMPNSVTSIGYYAFKGCKGLTSITIPNSVTSIGSSAFYFCTGLTSITIPNSVTSIGDDVFYYCTGLTSITIPDSVTSIGSRAFSGCSGLTSITIPNSITSIGDCAFSGCTGITSITIPNSVTSIGGSAFSGCTGITNIAIPDSIKSIGNNAFSNCTNLNTVTLPQYAVNKLIFKNFKSIKNIILDKNVTNVDVYGFPGCTGLEKIYGYNNVADSYAKKNNLTFYSLDAPAAPKIKIIGVNSIALEENAYYQYSMNGNDWKTENVFKNLTPDTEYKFYQRIYYADIKRLTYTSPALTVKTMQSKVDKPILIFNTTTDVVLKEIEGYEYSLDGITWQKSNVFSNLNPSTQYNFYQRIAETEISSASEKSPALTVKTFKNKVNDAVKVSLKELPVYNGKEITPKLTVTLYGKELDENKDYELEYSNNVNVGNNAKVFVKGKGEYAEIRYEFSFPICAADISNAKITVSDEYYTGRKLKPVPKIEMNGVQLTEGVDFVLQYESNIEIGTAKVKVIGVGNYCGKTIAAFKIERKNTSTEYYKNVPFYNGDRKEITVLKGTVLEGIVQNIDKYSTLKPTYDIKEVLTFDPVTYKNVYTKKYTVSGVNSENKLNYTFNKTGTYLVTCVWEEVRCKYRYEYVNGNRVAILESETRTGIGQAGYIITVVEPETGTPDYPDTPQPPKQLVAGVPIVQGIRNIYLQPETNEENEKLSNVTWKSSDQEIATVDNGKITIKKSGKVIITASCNGKNAIWELEFEPLNLEKYGSILRYDSEKQTATVMFKNEVLIENVDYVLNKEKIGEMLIVTVRGINMFEGELCSAFYSANGNKYYCEHVYSSNTDTVCSLCHEKRKLPYTLGDLNNDNKINSLDGLLLLRYLNGWDVEIASPDAMDINGDSKVNSLDGLLLLRYLNGWDIDLGEETDPTPPSGGETENPNPPSEDDDKSWSAAEVATLKVSSNSIATDVSDFPVACVTFKAFISAGGVYGKEQATIKATEIKSSILKIRNQVNSLYELVESRNDISYLDKDGKTYYLKQAYETAKSITDNLYSRNISGTSTLAESEEYVNLAQELWKACTLMNDIAKSV